MAYRANQAFMSYAGGTPRVFKKGDIVPDEIAAKVLALTYADTMKAADVSVVEVGPAPKPRKRTAKKPATGE